MEEFVPFILILIGTHPDYPEKLEVQRKGVFESFEECELNGDDAIEGRKMYKLEYGGANYQFYCIPSANTEETDEVWRNKIERIERERLEREKFEKASK